MQSTLKQTSRRVKVSLPYGQRELWSARDIMLRWNISAPTFWRYRKQGLIPPPDRKIGPRGVWSRERVISIEHQTSAA